MAGLVNRALYLDNEWSASGGTIWLPQPKTASWTPPRRCSAATATQAPASNRWSSRRTHRSARSYHHFPGGKEELGAEVIRRSGQMYEDLVMAIVEASPTLEQAVDNVFNGAASVLIETDYADACPIATVALEVASTNEPLREATAGSCRRSGSRRRRSASRPHGSAAR